MRREPRKVKAADTKTIRELGSCKKVEAEAVPQMESKTTSPKNDLCGLALPGR